MEGEKINSWILIVIGITAILVIIGIIVTMIVLKRKKEGKIQEPNYQAFFSFGIIWIPIGIVLKNNKMYGSVVDNIKDFSLILKTFNEFKDQK